MIPTNCIILDQPEYPREVSWEVCETVDNEKVACLYVEHAKTFITYMKQVIRYHQSIQETCHD